MAIVAYTVNTAAKFMLGNTGGGLGVILLILCIAALIISEKRNDLNVSKTVLGAMLMWFLKDEVSYLFGYVIPDRDSGGAYSGNMGTVYLVMEFAVVVMYAFLFVNHLAMISGHKSRPDNLLYNQIIAVAIIVISVFQAFFTFSVVSYETVSVIEIASWQIALIAFLVIIVCIETKVDEYKGLRESSF